MSTSGISWGKTLKIIINNNTNYASARVTLAPGDNRRYIDFYELLKSDRMKIR